MSTQFTRNYNWVNDKNASIPITASRFDLEMDDMTTKLNQKVVIRSTAPASPIAGMIWMDSSVSPAQPKIYTGSAWTDLESIKGADIASATTTDIGAATGRFVDVTGTTTITGLGTVRAGTIRFVRFTGALTLTHNATSLILPSSANITTVNGDVAGFVSLGSGNWKCIYYQRQDGTSVVAGTAVGQVIQVVNTQSGAVATGTTVIPQDDTIPQNTEGDEYITRAITPGNTNNKLMIIVVCHIANGTSGTGGCAALFQDSTAGALACGNLFLGSAGQDTPVVFIHYMTAGTTSSTTFKVRAGFAGAGTTTFNGIGGGRQKGGVLASSITILEIKV